MRWRRTDAINTLLIKNGSPRFGVENVQVSWRPAP